MVGISPNLQQRDKQAHAIDPDDPPTRKTEDEAESDSAEIPSSIGRQSG